MRRCQFNGRLALLNLSGKGSMAKPSFRHRPHPRWIQKRRLKTRIGEIGLEGIGIIKPNPIIPNINCFSSTSSERCNSCHSDTRPPNEGRILWHKMTDVQSRKKVGFVKVTGLTIGPKFRLTNLHKICIFNQQSTISNPKGGGVDISSLPGKKPGIRKKLS